MTSTAPGAHPEPEEVDALLDPSGGDARVDAHVAGCARCRQVRDGLVEVRALLGRQAHDVPPEPPDLGARIAAALAAEPPLRTSVSAGAPEAGAVPGTSDGATVVPLAPRRRRPARTWLAVAASVAVVGLGGTFLATRLGDATVSEAGASAEHAPGAQEDASAGGSAGADGSGTTAEPDLQGGSPTRASGDVGAFAAVVPLASGTAYTRAALDAQAAGLLLRVELSDAGGDPSGESEGSEGSQGSEGPQGRDLLTADRLGRCLDALGRSEAELEVTDVATFEDEPAVVLVLRRTGGHDVLVVPPGCGSGDDRVLARASLDR